MDSLQAEKVKERETLMQAFEKLELTCIHLKEAVKFTEKLQDKFNRRERDILEVNPEKKKDSHPPSNIVDLFISISDKMEKEIIEIINNTEDVIKMIE